MRDLHFMPKAWEDLGWWMKNDLKAVKKIYTLLENCCKTPFEGTGQPEPLKANYAAIGREGSTLNIVSFIRWKMLKSLFIPFTAIIRNSKKPASN